jgi:hypothetical protein
MEITELINHPERMDRNTLYELRSTLAMYPYFQTARLLMLQNLYILHDESFDQELRKSAVYITNRKAIFDIVEAAHYLLKQEGKDVGLQGVMGANRTFALIDSFLDSIPAEDSTDDRPAKRRPTPADAAIDYMAYLLQTETSGEEEGTPLMKGQDLIDTFLEQENGRILLNTFTGSAGDEEQTREDAAADDNEEEEYFTETLARIYIRQGRYQKALEITERLSRKYPQKNAYFADQIRFLEKLIINSNNKFKN